VDTTRELATCVSDVDARDCGTIDALADVTRADSYHDATSATESPWPEQGLVQELAISKVRALLFGAGATVAIGRYRLERRLGAGGMGEVYLGFDDELDRRVAIKRVRADRSNPTLRERLRREARALAKLSHPNVVQVYEVGGPEQETFLVMEFVEGQTLRAWLEQPRGWREILAVFLAAGRGLAAAHSAGVVHRDFKPENVLIGADGRVRVADFGLAFAPELETTLREGQAQVADESLTNSGALLGTLRYMPLEQLAAGRVDARSDQFAFCVALYEALCGHEPFRYESFEARVEALERDAPNSPGRGMPRRIWSIASRGLRRDPDARWPDLDALLEALERVPAHRRLTIVALVAPLAIAVGWWLAASPPDPCERVEAELEGIWDAATRAQVAEVIAASELPHANTSLARLDSGLARWQTSWANERSRQCHADVAGSDPPELSSARRACLDRQRYAVEVLRDELLAGGPALVEHLVDVAANLPDPAQCSPARVLAQPPLDAAVREQVDALHLELAAARQRRLLGLAQVEHGTDLVEAAAALGVAPVLAEATAELGKAQLEMGSPTRGLALLEQAADQALRAGHEHLLAEIWLELALHRLTKYRDLSLGERDWKLADAQWSRLAPDPRTRARLRYGQARLSIARGELEAAAATIEGALAELEEGPSAERPVLLGALAELSEGETAVARHRAALEAAEHVWGSQHPHTADYLRELGLALLEQQPSTARPLLERAVAIWSRSHAQEPHPDLARAHLILARLALHDYGDARDDPERERLLGLAEHHALACARIQAQTLAPKDAARGDAFNILRAVAAVRGASRDALAHSITALEFYAQEGESLAHVLQQRYELGCSLLSVDESTAAAEQFQLLLEHGSGPRYRSLAHLGLAELALRRGDPSGALAQLELVDVTALDIQRIGYRLVRALAELRVGCVGCRASAELLVREVVDDPELGAVALGVWVEELEPSDDERRLLAPLL
jgi:predicted Ser/Thr protein kinase